MNTPEIPANPVSENQETFRSRGLTRRFLVALGTLVLAGSVALLGVLQWLEKRQAEQSFLQQARTNAHFLGQMNLPLSKVLAGHLETLTGWRVYFRLDSPTWIGAVNSAPLESPGDPGIVQTRPDGGRSVVLPVAGQSSGVAALAAFVQPPDALTTSLTRPAALAALGAFLLVALAVGYWLARNLIRPLRSFAATLPQIGSDAEPILPEAQRNDELGHVARTFLATQKQLREERAKRLQAERLATLGQMAASLAHEVRNPVAAIRMHAELVEADGMEKCPETSESLAHIMRESDKIENLVQQWSFFARPEPPRTKTADLRELVRQVTSLLLPAANRARLHLEVTLPSTPILADFDATRINQTLTNVLQNAIHASPEGSTISIRAEACGATSQIVITDAGSGFSPAALQKFSEPFFSEKEGGMGLGLTVATELAIAHGGTLRVENLPAGGARVTLQLRALIPPSPAP